MAVCVTFSNTTLRYNSTTDLKEESETSEVAPKVTIRYFDSLKSSDEIERTISNYDINFSRLLIELLDKLRTYSEGQIEKEMMNLVFRLDHNGYYSEYQRKLISGKQS